MQHRYQRCSATGYRGTVFRISHLVKNNYIKIRAQRAWIDNANYFRLIPVPALIPVLLISLKLQPRYVTSEVKKDEGEREEIHKPGNNSIPTVFLKEVRHEIRNYASS